MRHVGACLLLLILTAPVSAVGNEDVVSELLRLPAPPPDWQQRILDLGIPFKKDELLPPEDSLPDVLLDWWLRHGDVRSKQVPSPEIQAKLIRACESKAELLPHILPFLSATAEQAEFIKKRYDLELLERKYGREWKDEIEKWLMLNTGYLRDQLIQKAADARYDHSYIKGEDEFRALARLDWSQAKPVLDRYANADDARLRSLAAAIDYEIAIKTGAGVDKLRDKLKQIVANPDLPGYARNLAFESLTSVPWQGMEKWYISLFHDPTFRELDDDYIRMEPLSQLVAADPDRWIPIITAMIEDPDEAVHDAAVTCLIQFQLDRARKDALKPLLPWLCDPSWSSAGDRLRLIQSMDLKEVDLPESVPGLICVLEKSTDEWELEAAASALIKYPDVRAIPGLKRALAQPIQNYHRRPIVNALLECGGLSVQEITTAVEAYARLTATDAGQKTLAYLDLDDENVSPEVSLALHLIGSQKIQNSTAMVVWRRALEIEKKEPEVATQILRVAESWPLPSVDSLLLGRFSDGKADLTGVLYALNRRKQLRLHASSEMTDLLQGSGTGLGIAASLSEDSVVQMRTLLTGDEESQRALFACARIMRDQLPGAGVAHVLKAGNAHVVAAAVQYLESEDSPGSRELLRSLASKDIIPIWGVRSMEDPGHETYPAFNQFEQKLRSETRNPDGPDEVIALLSAGYFGDAGQFIIRIRNGDAELELPEESRYRKLSAGEMTSLRTFLSMKKIEDLAPLDQEIADGMQYEFVHITKSGGRRLFMNNPGFSAGIGKVYGDLVQQFRQLAGSGTFIARNPDGSHVYWKTLISDKYLRIFAVSWHKSDLMVFLSDEYQDKPEWRRWVNGKTESVTDALDPLIPEGSPDDVPEDMYYEQYLNKYPWVARSGADLIRVGAWNDKNGLFRCKKGETPVLVADGVFADPVLTPDGKWAVLAESGGDTWAVPNKVVRVNLATGKKEDIAIPAADTLNPVAYVAPWKKVLLMRQGDPPLLPHHVQTGPGQPEYYLLDPETGKTDQVQGDFRPWSDQTFRPLQPTGRPDETWVALPDFENGRTTLGRYDIRHFRFTPVETYPYLLFGSMEMWVDESSDTVYLVSEGQLLSVPLHCHECKDAFQQAQR